MERGETRTSVLELLEKFFKSRLDARGRIYLPKEVRERFRIKEGDRIYIELESEGNRLILYTARMIEENLRKPLSLSTT